MPASVPLLSLPSCIREMLSMIVKGWGKAPKASEFAGLSPVMFFSAAKD